MKSTKNLNIDPSIRPFRFESYGVKVGIVSNEQGIIDQAAQVCRKSLLNNVTEFKNGALDHYFEMPRSKSGLYRLIQNQKEISSGRSSKRFFSFFDSIIRVAIGEYAVDWVFIHAGVVGWRGKAIVIPADSYKGKTTLVAELVRRGATYYSDEFAIFDKSGLVHPFPRPLSMRSGEGKFKTYVLTVEDLGGTYGIEPIPVGMVLITEYLPDKRWSPQLLSSGQGVLEMIPHTLPIRYKPDFSIKVLNNIASRAIIASSPRGTAEKFSKTLLNFVDKHLS